MSTRRTQQFVSARKGFTLIELLVVIAIIAILAAILFPVFARARENARRATCQSNFKQIALGILQYTQDYDEKFPPYQSAGQTWMTKIQPYMKSEQILQCMSTRAGAATNYALNLNLGWSLAADAAGAKSLAVLTQPALTVLNAEEFQNHWTVGCDYDASGGVSTYWDCATPGKATFFYRAEDPVAQRHLGGANFSFTDGHVKWYKGANNTTMENVWNEETPGSVSGSNPTFKIDP